MAQGSPLQRSALPSGSTVTVDNVLDGLKLAHEKKLAALGRPWEALAEITTTADALARCKSS